MAKVTALQGKATGKIGSIVYSVNAGQQIAREYQPNVANPSTNAQVAARSALKLGSQLAAALAPVIAIPKEGMVSARNRFIKKNYGYISASNTGAQVSYENLQLALGNAGLPQLTVTRDANNKVTVKLANAAEDAVSRVVYILYKKTDENGLQLISSTVCTAAGDDGKFECEVGTSAGEIIVWGYGMKDLNAAATGHYGDMAVQTGEDIASLIARRKLDSKDYQFTRTRGCTMGADGSVIEPVDPTQARVFVTASPAAGGTVSGAGTFAIGSQVTVSAVMNENYNFLGWWNQDGGTETRVSTSTSFTFELQGQTDLVAKFEYDNNGDPDPDDPNSGD